MRHPHLPAAASLLLSNLWLVSVCPVSCSLAQEPLTKEAQTIEIRTTVNDAGAALDQVVVEAVRAVPALRMGHAMQLQAGRVGQPTGLPFDLSNLVLAKFDDGPTGGQLVALIEQTRTEQKDVTVTRIRQEIQKRKVLVGPEGDKQEVDQEFTVAIPFTQTIQAPVQVPVGKKPTAFSLDSLRIYRLDGTKVNPAEARTLLEKMSPIFLLRGFDGDIKPVGGVYLQALNPNCLIVVTEQAE